MTQQHQISITQMDLAHFQLGCFIGLPTKEGFCGFSMQARLLGLSFAFFLVYSQTRKPKTHNMTMNRQDVNKASILTEIDEEPLVLCSQT